MATVLERVGEQAARALMQVSDDDVQDGSTGDGRDGMEEESVLDIEQQEWMWGWRARG